MPRLTGRLSHNNNYEKCYLRILKSILQIKRLNESFVVSDIFILRKFLFGFFVYKIIVGLCRFITKKLVMKEREIR